LRMGATFFLRMEWMTKANGKIYLTETGFDGFLAEPDKIYNGKAAKHLHHYTLKPGLIDHPYGSILMFDPVTNEMTALLPGGSGTTFPSKHLSNPDAITTVEKNGKTFLIIQEDIFNSNRGRASDAALMEKNNVNEIYWLDLSIAKPTIDDLQRFVTAPLGAETSGGTFIKGNSRYYFFNIQHPSRNNPAPFNKSCTVVIDLGK
ncbi:MAG: DUF839 domain-containing protein, partial [Cytophagales bacterium]|nr:DUF839 domain-containing protein [Cytophaga sp.]